jgi:hypothetical protein
VALVFDATGADGVIRARNRLEGAAAVQVESRSEGA